MQESTPTKSAYTPNANGEVRFIVNSASEAVKKVREEIGPDAKVISVQQVKGSGLSRFLATPKLEILARVQSRFALWKKAMAEAEPRGPFRDY